MDKRGQKRKEQKQFIRNKGPTNDTQYAPLEEGEWQATHKDFNPGQEVIKKEELIPGINCRPVDPEFDNKVSQNIWHDKPELKNWAKAIDYCAVDALGDAPGRLNWVWTKNWDCKYIDIRIDMRDGGFIVKDQTGKRISLEQLLYQYRTPSEEEYKKYLETKKDGL